MAKVGPKRAAIAWPLNAQVVEDIDRNFDALFLALGTAVLQTIDPLLITVRNDSGTVMQKGEVVYVSGGTGSEPLITRARADVETTMPAHGLVYDTIQSGKTGTVILFGLLTLVDTSGFSQGDKVYVSPATAGVLTGTKPSGTDIPQIIARVIRSDARFGILMVLPHAAQFPITHGLLSSSHSDVLVASVVHGDLIWGNSTPKWARFPLGTSSGIAAIAFLGNDGSGNITYTAVGTALSLNMDNAVSGTLARARGGTGVSGAALGDLLVGTVLGWDKLTAGADGTIVVADASQTLGVSWKANPAQNSQVAPVGLHAGNNTDVTAMVAATCYCVYLGRATRRYTSADLITRVSTACVTITWAEVAIFSGVVVPNGNASLTRRGYTDVSTTYNSTGVKKTSITLTGVLEGADLWAVVGSDATTPFQLRACLADDIQSGVVQTVAARPSTAGAGTATTLAGNTDVPPRLQVQLS